jgi:hypothetical protein
MSTLRRRSSFVRSLRCERVALTYFIINISNPDNPGISPIAPINLHSMRYIG